MILTPLQKLPKNVRDLGKLIVAKGYKKLSKVQKIARSGLCLTYSNVCSTLNSLSLSNLLTLFLSLSSCTNLSPFLMHTYT